MGKYSILMASSEAAPYAKTGGLGDVVSALYQNFKRNGHEIRLILPGYKKILEGQWEVEGVLESMCVPMGEGEIWCSVKRVSGTEVYLIQHDNFFSREELYNDSEYQEYVDNPYRYGFFCRAVLQFAIDTGFSPDIIHVNDWQTGVIPAYIKREFSSHPSFRKTASVLTIHNIAYQGSYHSGIFRWLGLDINDFNPDVFEDHGKMNFLKGGVAFADMVNTVSPTYAEEVRQPGGGFGLAPYLTNKGESFCGILNGVDYNDWSPWNDSYIKERYSLKRLEGKAVCKRDMQERMGLKPDPDVPVIGMISRIVHQKGFDLVRDMIENILHSMSVQFTILGTGERELENFFSELHKMYPGRVGVHIGFNNELAHVIEAGSDMFCMPSLFEPCGLNQLYSLKYGAVPIVRATGGLNDTVVNYDEKRGTGTGFKFYYPGSLALADTIGWAVSTYYDRPDHFQAVRIEGMNQDFSWKRSAARYLKLYRMALKKKHNE
ncbi:MAG: glycogen synthase GlgA [Chitinivibrionales bacterium]